MPGYVGSHEDFTGRSVSTYQDYLDEYIWREMVLNGKAQDAFHESFAADELVPEEDRVYGEVTYDGYRTGVMNTDTWTYEYTRKGYIDNVMQSCVNVMTDWSHDEAAEALARETFLQDVADRKAYLASLTVDTAPAIVRDDSGLLDLPLVSDVQYSGLSAAQDILSAASPEDLAEFRAAGDASRGAGIANRLLETIVVEAEEPAVRRANMPLGTPVESSYPTRGERSAVRMNSMSDAYGFAATQASAENKLVRMMENPTAFPSAEDFLTDEELGVLNDQELLEQYSLMRFCVQEKATLSEEYVGKLNRLDEAMKAYGDVISGGGLFNVEERVNSFREKLVGRGDPGADGVLYDEYRSRIESVCLSRGYTLEQLEADSDRYITASRESSIMSMTGMNLNIHMLAAMNDTNEQDLYKYLMMSDEEKAMSVRFKPVIEGETKGVVEAGRWDGGRALAEPIQENATEIWFTDSDGNETARYPGDLMARMHPGTEYEVSTYRYYDNDGKMMMFCSSPYLGTFAYDPNDWAIGYKMTEDAGIQIPVFKYVGGLQHDVAHGDLSIAGNIFSGANVGETLLDSGPIGWVRGMVTGGTSGMSSNEQVHIPYGVKNLDYTFENNDEIQLIPGIPDTVTSMHCTFMNCDRLRDGSYQFMHGNTWHLPDGLEDASYAFSGCSTLNSETLGTFPDSLLTIEGMFYDCPEILEKRDWHDLTLDFGALFTSTVEADWSDSPYLMEEFAKPHNEGTSETMKANAKREEQERKAFQFEFSKPEHLATLSEEELAKWEDAQAANAVVRTEKVFRADDTVRSLDEVSYIAPDENEFMAFMQRAVIDVGAFAAIKGVTKLVTKSKVASWVAGIGITAALRYTDVLPRSIEPALQLVKKILPESAQEKFDKFIQFIHIPQEEDYAQAREDQMNMYVDLGLEDSISRSAWSADVFYDDKSVYDALAVNGKSVAVKGILAQAGKNGREGSYIVSEVLSVPLGQAEQVFDKKMSASASGVDDGYDWPDEMRRYYWQMLYGLEGYSNGAIEGIVSTYGESEDAYTATMGLAYVNCDYAASVVSSLRTMDDKYHFMTDEYWEKIDNLDILGVGKLSEYQHVAGPHMQPVFPELDEVQPATPSVAASFDTATDAVDGYTATADVSLEEDSQLAMIRRRSAELATYFDESVVGAEADIEPSTV